MNFSTRVLLVVVLFFSITSLTRAYEARVIKATGLAEMTLAGGSTLIRLGVNSLIPEGATVTTGAGSELTIETLPGAIVTVNPTSTLVVEKLQLIKNGDVITEQTVTLNLKQGKVLSTLDPARKAINRYGVRTPKGVAAARGTVYAVRVDVMGSSIATLSGQVTLDLGDGRSLSIPVGTSSVNGAATTTLAAAIASNPALAQDIATAVSVVAAQVSMRSSAVETSASALAVLASVLNAASAALPEQAANFMQQAVQAVAAPTSAVFGAATDEAVATLTEAAVQGAVQTLSAANPAAAQQVTGAITNAAVATAASSGIEINVKAIQNAASKGAASGAANATAPASNPDQPNANSVAPKSTPRQINPIDPSVVSPSS